MKRQTPLDEPTHSIEAVAGELGVPRNTLNRWHYLGWAACSDYVSVGVPIIGWVSARRWSKRDVKRLKANLRKLDALERDRKSATRAAVKFGRRLAQAHLQLIDLDSVGDCPIPECFRDLAEDSHGYGIGFKSAVQSLLKEQHRWACLQLESRIPFRGTFLTNCTFEIDWYVPLASEGPRLFYYRSKGGMQGGRPWYRIHAASLGTRTVKGLSEQSFRRSEYEFINRDPEIGALDAVSYAEKLFVTQLHEVAHAAKAWAESRRIALPKDMIVEEVSLRTDPEKADGSHDAKWSSIYRFLRRAAGLVQARTAIGATAT